MTDARRRLSSAAPRRGTTDAPARTAAPTLTGHHGRTIRPQDRRLHRDERDDHHRRHRVVSRPGLTGFEDVNRESGELGNAFDLNEPLTALQVGR